MRTRSALRNAYWGIISQIVILFLGFVSRKVFLMILDSSYLGLNSLFTNIISVISLAELGISNAIIYHLYRPLANNDTKEIAKLMNFYKRAYRLIAVVVAAIGLGILPFLHIIITDQTFPQDYIRIIFFLFLIDAVASYFFSYKRSIIFADQKNYVIIKINTLYKIILTITQIVILFITKNFVLYLVLNIIFKLFENITIAKIADKNYPYINERVVLESEKRKRIFTNIKDIFINKLSWTVTNSTDDIIISMFSNLSVIGFISNYNMLILAIQSLVAKTLDATQAGIGNLLAEESKDHIYTVLKRYSLLAFLIASFCGISLYTLSSPFIALWLGKEYIINSALIWVLVFNFFLLILRTPLWQMVGVSGLFRQEKNIALVGTAFNIIFSVLLAKSIGVVGVYIGTTISMVVQIFLKIPLFFKRFLQKNFWPYFYFVFSKVFIYLGELVLVQFIISFISIEMKILEFFVFAAVCLLVPNGINYLIYRRSEEFVYLKSMVTNIMARKARDSSH